MTSSEAAIEIERVSKRFGRRPAVTDLSLRVPVGSVFGLLGHNGAGKSTTLGMLLGQVFPDRGSLRIAGHDVFRRRADALARVGAIFETPAFHDYLSGRRNLQILSAYSGHVDRGRIDEVVELLGLTARIDHRVSTYSHGMRQRLGLAQALLPRPDLLILDEPADGLDPQGIHDMRAFIRRLNRTMGMTIVFSSHQLHEVEQLATHLAVLHQGRLVFRGTLADAKLDTRMLSLETDRRAEAVALLRSRGLIAVNDDAAPENKLPLVDGATPAQANRLLVEHGFGVSRIGLDALSLEEFYLRLVRQGDPEDRP